MERGERRRAIKEYFKKWKDEHLGMLGEANGETAEKELTQDRGHHHAIRAQAAKTEFLQANVRVYVVLLIYHHFKTVACRPIV